jgi:hypothetical protein
MAENSSPENATPAKPSAEQLLAAPEGDNLAVAPAPPAMFIGNRPIASNEAIGDDALMGYLD